MKKLLFTLILCVGCCGLPRDYVEQDRASFDTLAPRVRAMVAETQLYDDTQKKDILDRLISDDLRITKAQELYND